jgi:hypothetical protein
MWMESCRWLYGTRVVITVSKWSAWGTWPHPIVCRPNVHRGAPWMVTVWLPPVSWANSVTWDSEETWTNEQTIVSRQGVFLSPHRSSVGGGGHGRWGGCSFTGYFESKVRFRFFRRPLYWGPQKIRKRLRRRASLFTDPTGEPAGGTIYRRQMEGSGNGASLSMGALRGEPEEWAPVPGTLKNL